MSAKVFGPTLHAVAPSVLIDPADPSRGPLNREDLEVARAYHDATTVVRRQVRSLLTGTAARDERIAGLTPARQQLIDDLINALATDHQTRTGSA